ncbi:uncharacterized protein LOC135366023 [Ornithodoros turicata]|uniref:uncharacterized protein LOC135366023 n=1 Tax=Ornithodoros turicata TaxID=34597 RepID=UPI0031386CCD
MATAAATVPPEIERLKPMLGLPDEFELQSCGKADCWMLNKLVSLNEIISRAKVELREEEKGEVTLTSWGSSNYLCTSKQIVLFLMRWHSCILHFNFRHAKVTMMQEVMLALDERTDVVSFCVTKVLSSYGESKGMPKRLEKPILNFIQRSSALRTFKLHEKKVCELAAKRIGEALATKASLKVLSLESEPIIHFFLGSFAEKTTIDKLSLESVSFHAFDSPHAAQIPKLIESVPTVTCLDLSGCRWEHSYGQCDRDKVELIAEALKKNASVKTLLLVNSDVEPESLHALADMLQHNKTLSTLDISHNVIALEEASHIAESLRTTSTLKSLKLQNCTISLAAIREIVAALKENPQGPVVDLGNQWALGYTPSDVVSLVVQEKVDKVQFPWIGEIIKSVGGIPDWYKVVHISVSVEREDDDKMKGVCAYFEQRSARAKSFNISCEKKSSMTCVQITDLLLRNCAIEELYLNPRPVPADVLREFAEALGTNTHLRSLHISMGDRWGAKYCADIKEAAFFARALGRNRTLEVFDCHLIFNRDAMQQFSTHLDTNYALVEFRFYTRVWYEIVHRRHYIGRRNAVLQQQAAHFALGDSLRKRWAAAFSLTHNTGTLRKKLEEATGKSEEEVRGLIRAKLFHLQVNFFKITEIVKERVVCNAAPLGVVQIDRLDLPLLAHIASFLKVGDVK